MKILITNFHPHGGGGHVTYIRSLLAIQNDGDVRIAVTVPERSLLYQYLKESGYPDLYVCDFPGKLQKELPSIIRSIRRFRKIVSDFEPDIVHVNGGPDLNFHKFHRIQSQLPAVGYNGISYNDVLSYNKGLSKTSVAESLRLSAR